MTAKEVFGPFELLGRLASGGMATTHLARLIGADRGTEIVIKRILPKVADDPELRDLFRAEAKVAEKLVHPCVVRTLGAGQIDGELYLALEYIWGDDLRGIVRAARTAGKQLPRPLAARIIAEAAKGLHYAHEFRTADGDPLELVHRDVSPPNIMVDFRGRVVVVDFGIAKVERRHQDVRAGQLKGKFAYMSPEQVQGRPVDRRSDIFSLGTLLYEFTAMRRLFRGESDIATIAAVSAAEFTPLSEIDPAYPPELEAAVTKALAAEPEDRWQTAQQLADALERWLETVPDSGSDALAAWMLDALAARATDIDALLGEPYNGPSGLPVLPSTEDAPVNPAIAMSNQDDTEPANDEPAATETPTNAQETAMPGERPVDGSVVSAMHEIPSDPDNDPFLQASRGGRGVYAVVGVVLAAMFAFIGYKIATEGIGTSHLADYDAGPSMADFDAAPYEPPPPPTTTPTAIQSTPAGASIVVNGVATRETTPATVALVDGSPNVISLHLEGHETVFVEARAGAATAVELRVLPEPEPDPEPDPEPGSEPPIELPAEGSAEPVDPGPGLGRARIVVRAHDTATDAVPAEILVNGVPVGTAPVRVDVDAGTYHHISARLASKRDSATYVRPIAWVDRNSEHVVELELTADAGESNRWTTVRVSTSPRDAQVQVNGEPSTAAGILNVDSPQHHVISVSAPDHESYTRAIDGRLGQFVLHAVLTPIRNDPATVTFVLTPPETTVFAELLRHGSPGATQLRPPLEAMALEAGTYRFTLEHRAEEGRVRGRFEVELLPGNQHTLDYQIVDGEFVQAAHDVVEMPVADGY